MRVNEIFYSLQGEGYFTGTAATFVRLSGCNLACDFCDTEYNSFENMTEEEILQQVIQYPSKHVVITGGEPTLQLTRSLLELLHEANKYVQIETNGTMPLQDGLDELIDWITLSPKQAQVRIQNFHELKVVYEGQDMQQYADLMSRSGIRLSLQPCDRGDEVTNVKNVAQTMAYVQSHPQWRLSLQTHKILSIR